MLGIILLIYSVIIITWKYDTRTLLYYYIFLKHQKKSKNFKEPHISDR